MTASRESSSLCGDDPVLRAAIQWRIQLNEASEDAALRGRFERWLAEDRSHALAVAHADRVFGLIGQTKSVAILPAGGKTRPASPAPSPRAWRRAGIAAIAAAALLAVFAPQVMLRWGTDYVTGAAGERLVTLDDASTVRLAPGSAIDLDYAEDRRGVRLLSGEAYFEVTPDPARPFSVDVRAASVTVLGTGFNVRLGEQTADVAVRHGRVRVDYPGGRRPVSSVLTDGQWTRIAWDGAATRGDIAPEIVGGWGSDRIVAVDQPLSEVVADLRRYYDGVIVLRDEAMGRRVVTGAYDVSDPVRALGVIVGPLGGTVIQVTPWIAIISPS